jgi:hypothetical protein
VPRDEDRLSRLRSQRTRAASRRDDGTAPLLHHRRLRASIPAIASSPWTAVTEPASAPAPAPHGRNKLTVSRSRAAHRPSRAARRGPRALSGPHPPAIARRERVCRAGRETSPLLDGASTGAGGSRLLRGVRRQQARAPRGRDQPRRIHQPARVDLRGRQGAGRQDGTTSNTRARSKIHPLEGHADGIVARSHPLKVGLAPGGLRMRPACGCCRRCGRDRACSRDAERSAAGPHSTVPLRDYADARSLLFRDNGGTHRVRQVQPCRGEDDS